MIIVIIIRRGKKKINNTHYTYLVREKETLERKKLFVCVRKRGRNSVHVYVRERDRDIENEKNRKESHSKKNLKKPLHFL